MTTLDLPASLQAIGSCPRRSITTEWVNTKVVQPAIVPGSGLFIEMLIGEIERRGPCGARLRVCSVRQQLLSRRNGQRIVRGRRKLSDR